MKKEKLRVTERSLIHTHNADLMSVRELLKIINEEDKKVPKAVEKAIPSIEKAVNAIVKCFKKGGRLFYIGSGTSGRLGILDASECPPTFGVSPDMVQGIIAGGRKAVFRSVEQTEDNAEEAVKDLKKVNFSSKDILCAISASGSAPYVLGAVKYAKKRKAVTIGIACNDPSELLSNSDITVAVIVGPEVLSGSTRLKAGTATKLVLNMLSTVSMIKSGKSYGNLMVDMKPSNEKLKKRALKMLKEIIGKSDEESAEILEKSKFNLKVAALMGLSDVDKVSAQKILNSSEGNLRVAISKLMSKKLPINKI